MERNRSTHKQSRRHDALRRTLRRQGVLPSQEGGARDAAWALFPKGDITIDTAYEFLKANVLDASSEFSFLVADGDWRVGPEAAKQYATLIMKQDDILSLGLEKVRSALGIMAKTTDSELVDKVFATSDDNINTYNAALRILAESVIQSNATTGGKIAVNLGATTPASARPKLISLLLYPTLMTNVVVNGIAEVLKMLKRNEETYNMVVSKDETKRSTYHAVLADKYTWYIFGAAASYTNDSLKDSFCLWETNNMANELRWKAFFTEFFGHLVNGEAISFGSLPKLLQRTYKTEEYIMKDIGNARTPDTVICSLLSALVFRAFKEGKDMKGCIAPFAVRPADKAELQDMPTPKPMTADMRPYRTAPTVQQLTGMLADPTTWDQQLFGGDDELSKQITFTNLLNNLNPRHIHFLLHLVYVLYQEISPITAGASA